LFVTDVESDNVVDFQLESFDELGVHQVALELVVGLYAHVLEVACGGVVVEIAEADEHGVHLVQHGDSEVGRTGDLVFESAHVLPADRAFLCQHPCGECGGFPLDLEVHVSPLISGPLPFDDLLLLQRDSN